MKRILGLVLMVGVGLVSPALAQPKYDPGASDVEIKIGNIVPYSGPVSMQIRPLARDYLVVRNLQMSRFDGESYRPIGPILELQR